MPHKAKFCPGHPPFMGSYPLLGATCVTCGKETPDQHFKLCQRCSSKTNRCQYCGKGQDSDSPDLPEDAIQAHEAQASQVTTAFWDTHCPATMGGQCSYVDGVCRMCDRVLASPSAEETPQQAKSKSKSKSTSKSKSKSSTCPATMGGRCRYVDGVCTLCEEKAPE